jgi:hypothetical protein
MRVAKKISKLAKELAVMSVDVSEIRIAVDAEYQAAKLAKKAKELEDLSTEIHGGGTGQE